MSKQKFQIGDKVYVKRGNKNEIGRVGKVTNIYKLRGRLGYNVKYNDGKYPKSGAFYADMLLFSDMHSLANHMTKDCVAKNENTNNFTKIQNNTNENVCKTNKKPKFNF